MGVRTFEELPYPPDKVGYDRESSVLPRPVPHPNALNLSDLKERRKGTKTVDTLIPVKRKSELTK